MKKLNKEIEKMTKGFSQHASEKLEQELLYRLRRYMDTKEGIRIIIISKDESIRHNHLVGNKSTLRIIQQLQKKAGL